MRGCLLKGFFILLLTSTLVDSQQAEKVALAFEGNKVISEKELVGVTDKCLAADRQWNDRYDSEVLDYCLRRLKFSLIAKGYWQATLGVPRTQKTENGLSVIVPLEEGALYRLGEVQIKGSSVFPSAKLREMLDLKTGDIADGERIGEWLFEQVRKAYNELGYIQYIAEPVPTFHLETGAQNGVVDLTVEIEEGKPFTIGLIKFEGNGNISAYQLRRQMLVRSGDIFNAELFEQSLKIISENNHYELINADKDVALTMDEEGARVNITIHLKIKPTTVSVNKDSR
jgi:outer membrane protein assembly factor BamA